MSFDELAKAVTVFGVVVAAVTGVWNLYLQLRGKSDHFVVGLGSVSPDINPETMLHVVSRSDHRIQLTDWGYIEADCRFTSFYLEWHAGDLQPDKIVDQGSSDLAGFGTFFETGYVRTKPAFGAYARSVTQRRPRLCFAPEMPYWKRLWIMARLQVQPKYLSW